MQLPNSEIIQQLKIFNDKHRWGSTAIDLEILAKFRLIHPIATTNEHLTAQPRYGEFYYDAVEVAANPVSRRIEASTRVLLPLLLNKWRLTISKDPDGYWLISLGKNHTCKIILSNESGRRDAALVVCRVILQGLLLDLNKDTRQLVK